MKAIFVFWIFNILVFSSLWLKEKQNKNITPPVNNFHMVPLIVNILFI